MTSTNFPLVLRSGLAGVAFLGISSLAHAQNPNSCPAGLQTLTTEIIAPDFCDEDEMTCLVTACANMNVPPGKAYNICFVIDDSTTMGGTDVDIAVVNDQNNDGKIQRIDAAIQGFLALSQAIQNLNPAPPIQISMVAFAKDAAILDLGPAPGQQTWIQSLTQDADTNGIADFEEVLRSLSTGGLGQTNVGKFTTHDWAPGTDYTEALNLMNQAFTTAPAFPPQFTVCNIGLFISDGLPNQTDITPKYNDAGGAVDQAAALGTIINAFGVGPDVSTLCDPGQPLDIISNTTGGDCQAKDDPTELTTALATGTLAQQIDKLELFVNNVLVASVLGPNALELKLLDVDIFPYITLGPNEVKAVATSTGGVACPATVNVDKTACLLLVGLYPAQSHIGGGDFIYVDKILQFNVTETHVPDFVIPNIPALVGVNVYFQVGMHNIDAFPQNPIQMSNGLRVTIGGGVQTYGGPTGILTWLVGGTNPGETFSTPFDVLAM